MNRSFSAMLRYWRHLSISRLVTLSVVGVLALAGCGDDSGTDPNGLKPSDVNGTWVITLTQLPSCQPIALSQLQVTVNFRVDGQTGTVGSSWNRGTGTPQLAASGQINFATGQADINLWGEVNVSALTVSGVMAATGSFTGTARDPAPGYDSVWSFGICQYTATGVRQ